MTLMKSGKKEKVKATEQPNQEIIRKQEGKEIYKYLNKLQHDILKQAELMEKIRIAYPSRMSKLLETKLYRRNRGSPSSKIHGTILHKGVTQKKWA